MVTTHRPVPATNDETCIKYGSTTRTCGCPDFNRRAGGSYIVVETREAICKHVYHRRHQAETAKARAIANIDRLFAKPPARLSARNSFISNDEYFGWLEPA